jgi:hypothetical protein
MAATAGRKARIKISGSSTAFTDEAFTDSGDHQTYQITNTAKRVWGRTSTITVKVGGSVTGESYTLNRLSGKVTFATVNAGRGAVTVTGNYVPMSLLAEAREFRATFSKTLAEDTSLGDADVTRVILNHTETVTIGRWYIDNFFTDELANQTLSSGFVVELFFDDAGTTPDCLIRTSEGPSSRVSGSTKTLIDEQATMESVTDADGRSYTFDV